MNRKLRKCLAICLACVIVFNPLVSNVATAFAGETMGDYLDNPLFNIDITKGDNTYADATCKVVAGEYILGGNNTLSISSDFLMEINFTAKFEGKLDTVRSVDGGYTYIGGTETVSEYATYLDYDDLISFDRILDATLNAYIGMNGYTSLGVNGDTKVFLTNIFSSKIEKIVGFTEGGEPFVGIEVDYSGLKDDSSGVVNCTYELSSWNTIGSFDSGVLVNGIEIPLAEVSIEGSSFVISIDRGYFKVGDNDVSFNIQSTAGSSDQYYGFTSTVKYEENPTFSNIINSTSDGFIYQDGRAISTTESFSITFSGDVVSDSGLKECSLLKDGVEVSSRTDKADFVITQEGVYQVEILSNLGLKSTFNLGHFLDLGDDSIDTVVVDYPVVKFSQEGVELGDKPSLELGSSVTIDVLSYSNITKSLISWDKLAQGSEITENTSTLTIALPETPGVYNISATVKNAMGKDIVTTKRVFVGMDLILSSSNINVSVISEPSSDKVFSSDLNSYLYKGTNVNSAMTIKMGYSANYAGDMSLEYILTTPSGKIEKSSSGVFYLNENGKYDIQVKGEVGGETVKSKLLSYIFSKDCGVYITPVDVSVDIDSKPFTWYTPEDYQGVKIKASSEVGIDKVNVYLDDVLKYTYKPSTEDLYSISIYMPSLEEDAFTDSSVVKVDVIDLMGNLSTKKDTLTVDETVPEVQKVEISSELNGSVTIYKDTEAWEDKYYFYSDVVCKLYFNELPSGIDSFKCFNSLYSENVSNVTLSGNVVTLTINKDIMNLDSNVLTNNSGVSFENIKIPKIVIDSLRDGTSYSSANYVFTDPGGTLTEGELHGKSKDSDFSIMRVTTKDAVSGIKSIRVVIGSEYKEFNNLQDVQNMYLDSYLAQGYKEEDFNCNKVITYNENGDIDSFSFDFKIINSGPLVMNFIVVDNAGTTGICSGPNTVIDLESPSVTVAYDSLAEINADSINLKLTVKDTNLDAIKGFMTYYKGLGSVVFDKNENGDLLWTKVSDTEYTINAVVDGDGENTFSLEMWDRANNYSYYVSPIIKIDRKTPNAKIVYTDLNNGSNKSIATVYVKDTNIDLGKTVIETSGVIQSKEWVYGDETYAYKKEILIDLSNDYYINVTTVDNAGNIYTIEDIGIGVDIRGPTIEVNGIDNGGVYNQNIGFTVEIADENLDVNKTEVIFYNLNRGYNENLSKEDLGNGTVRFTFSGFNQSEDIVGVFHLLVDCKDTSSNSNSLLYNISLDIKGVVEQPDDSGGGSAELPDDGDGVIEQPSNDESNSDDSEVPLQDTEQSNSNNQGRAPVVPTDDNQEQSQEVPPTGLIDDTSLDSSGKTVLTSEEYQVKLFSSGKKVEVDNGLVTVVKEVKNDETISYDCTVNKDSITVEGKYILQVCIGVELIKEFEFTVDTTKPKVQITGLKSGMTINEKEYQVQFEVSDLSGVKSIKVFANENKELTVNKINNETYYVAIKGVGKVTELRVVVEDNLGNSTEKSITDFTIDTDSGSSANIFILIVVLLILSVIGLVVILVFKSKKKLKDADVDVSKKVKKYNKNIVKEFFSDTGQSVSSEEESDITENLDS